ncbi:MAG: hypothetical protein ACLGQU_04225 [Acidobacteriota bacterium]
MSLRHPRRVVSEVLIEPSIEHRGSDGSGIAAVGHREGVANQLRAHGRDVVIESHDMRAPNPMQMMEMPSLSHSCNRGVMNPIDILAFCYGRNLQRICLPLVDGEIKLSLARLALAGAAEIFPFGA